MLGPGKKEDKERADLILTEPQLKSSLAQFLLIKKLDCRESCDGAMVGSKKIFRKRRDVGRIIFGGDIGRWGNFNQKDGVEENELYG
jgi:hypothetical protein